ncbi:helix-turn-helix domain-containing protein [Leclercia sp.]|uniref:helix-turn-helix domain-containing protein n=1 Tax=Leclercia sp. TaxID=1898428 RepID=UPI0028BF0687|nr:helix-turn-helix domain-containing protein [Leclercia sp.]
MTQLQNKLPSLQEAELARLCSRELSAVLETRAESQQVSLTDKRGQIHNVSIPVSALRMLVDVLTELGEGNAVRLVPVGAEMTTQEVADLLNISRPTLIRLLDNGELPYHRAGNRRKIRYVDALSYRNKLVNQRHDALDELGALDQELGLGYE